MWGAIGPVGVVCRYSSGQTTPTTAWGSLATRLPSMELGKKWGISRKSATAMSGSGINVEEVERFFHGRSRRQGRQRPLRWADRQEADAHRRAEFLAQHDNLENRIAESHQRGYRSLARARRDQRIRSPPLSVHRRIAICTGATRRIGTVDRRAGNDSRTCTSHPAAVGPPGSRSQLEMAESGFAGSRTSFKKQDF